MSAERLRATYLLETPVEVERIAEALAGELGAGSRVEAIRPLDAAAGPRLSGRYPEPVERWARAEVDVSLSDEPIGADLFALSTALLGNVFELREVSGLRLLDFTVPEQLAGAMPGPAFGVAGTRRLVNVQDRPLIGSIIKPSVGLTPEETADRVRALGLAAIDFVKDDELLANQPHSPLAERVAHVMGAVHEVAETTGRKVMYAFNVSSDHLTTLLRNHDTVVGAGGTCVMVSVNHVGLGGVMELRRHAQVPIHAHRNGWGMLTRSPGLGMEFLAYQKLWRLAGVDQIHVNGFSNKFFEADESVARSIAACLAPLERHGPVLPVVSSGQWGGQAPATYAATRTVDLLYLAGGGIQGHPDGIAAGVRAVQLAWEAALEGADLADKAAAHPELATAIAKFQ